MKYFIFILGIIMGSFYLVLATRLPNNEDIVLSRSHCDYCKKTLKWYQLIPIFSYLIFLGKCPNCNKRIPIINLITEIVTGFLFYFMYIKYGISYEFFCGLVISSLLVIIFISDFKYFIILDSPLIISSILILILKFCYFGHKAAFKALLSGAILFFIMYLIGKLGNFLFKKESLGGGDIKLSFVIGLILGVRLGLCVLILATFLALPITLTEIMSTKNNEIPLGPFLTGALFVIFIFMDKFTNLLNLIFNL